MLTFLFIKAILKKVLWTRKDFYTGSKPKYNSYLALNLANYKSQCANSRVVARFSLDLFLGTCMQSMTNDNILFKIVRTVGTFNYVQ
jgi:hypothetical protein